MAGPELQALVAMLRSSPLGGGSVEEARHQFDGMAAMFPLPDDVRFEPGVADGVPIERAVPAGVGAERVMLYLHGGAYVLGSITSHRSLVARLARAGRVQAVSVAYRLAPEHRFPAAIDDAVTAYRWLLAQGVLPGQVVIAGDSAGGGLTMATLLALKAAGAPMPGAAVCFSPWVDLEGVGESMTARAALDPIVGQVMLRQMAALYLADADPRAPLASPIHGDLSGLPPLLIQVGTSETLYDDAVRLHARARAAGVEATLDPWEEMIHVWQIFPMLPEAHQAVNRAGEFIQARLGPLT